MGQQEWFVFWCSKGSFDGAEAMWPGWTISAKQTGESNWSHSYCKSVWSTDRKAQEADIQIIQVSGSFSNHWCQHYCYRFSGLILRP